MISKAKYPKLRYFGEATSPVTSDRASSGPALTVDLIVIPCPASKLTRNWELELVLGTLGRDCGAVATVRTFWFDYCRHLSDVSTWNSFFELSGALLKILVDRQGDLTSSHRIVFACHSLGGLILKTTLFSACLAGSGAQPTLNCTLGIIFLSTPNTTKDGNTETWRRYSLITDFFRKRVSGFAPKLREEQEKVDRDTVCRVASNFRGTIENRGWPILSVYEGEKTRIGGRLRAKSLHSPTETLVDRDLATLDYHREELFKGDADHINICRLNMVGLRPRIRAFLSKLFKSAKRDEREPSIDPWEVPTGPGLLDWSWIPAPTQEGRPRSFERMTFYPYRDFPSVGPSYTLPVPSIASKVLSERRGIDDAGGDELGAVLPCRMPLGLPRNNHFYGRANELQELDRHCGQVWVPNRPTADGTGDEVCRQFAVSGMGGVGKTELVVEWAYRRMDDFHAVFWVDAADASRLASSYDKIIPALTLQPLAPGALEDSDMATRREAAKAWFKRAKVPWLLIFDNADNVELLSDYWPTTGSLGCVLVTSRDPESRGDYEALSGFSMPGLHLEPFDETEAADFIQKLTRYADTPDERQACLDISRQLGCLPLAIVGVAHVIRRRQWSVAKAVASCEADGRGYRNLWITPKPGTLEIRRYGKAATAAWGLDELDANTVELLQLLSMLGPGPVPERLFVFTPDEKDRFWDSIATLLSSSLIKKDKVAEELTLHRVIAEEVRARMPDEALHRKFRAAVELIHRGLQTGKFETGLAASPWLAYESTVLTHIEHAHRMYKAHKREWLKHSDDGTESRLIFLFQDAGACLYERGLLTRAKEYLDDALELASQQTDQPEVKGQEGVLRDLHYTLAAVASETNDAAGCMSHAAVAFRMGEAAVRERGTPDARFAAANYQMGVACAMAGQLSQASDHFKRSMSLYKGLPFFHVDMLALSMANLGLVYWMQGQLADAEETFAAALADRQKAFGEMDKVSQKTGRILYGYGNLKSSQAEAETKAAPYYKYKLESKELHKAALAQLESTIGEHHHRVADVCHKLAGHAISENNHDKAQTYFDRALRIWGDAPWHVNEVARTSFVKGTHLISRGGEHAKEGRQLVDEAARLMKRIKPDCDPSKATEKDYDELVVFWSR